MVEEQKREILSAAAGVQLLFQPVHDFQHIEIFRRVVVVHGRGLTAAVDVQRLAQVFGALRADQRDRRVIEVLVPQPLREAEIFDERGAEHLVAAGAGKAQRVVLKRAGDHAAAAVVIALEKVADRDIRARPVRETAELFVHVRRDPVVAVDEAQVLALCQRQGEIARPALAAVVDVQAAYLFRMRGGIALRKLTGSVGRAVVHQQELQIVHRLAEQRVDARGEILFHVVDRDDDAQLHLALSSAAGITAVLKQISASTRDM